MSCTESKYNLFNPEHVEQIDPALQLDRKDYQNLNDLGNYSKPGEPTLKPSNNVVEPPVPPLAEILASPKPPKLGQTQLVSIAVTDDVPLKDVLLELARLANVDIEVDAGITGGISFRAKDRPFNEVIERIADLAGLRYTMKDGVLRVERDTPYVQIYSLDFLNLDRSSQSSVNVSTSVLSSTGGGSSGSSGSSGSGSSGSSGSSSSSSSGSGGGLDNGSTASVSSKADSDFWKQFDESIKKILTYREPKHVSDIQIAEQPVLPPAATAGAAADGKAAGGAAAAPAPAPAPAPAAAAQEDATANNGQPVPGTFYIINREASTMTVSATERQHALVKEFLRRIQRNATAQVLIEAKIVEVTLNNEFQSGIDWKKLGNSRINFASTFGSVADKGNVATFSLAPNNDLDAAVQLAQTFGTTRTLSSPRLHAINNQQAVLTFAENQVYFTLTVQQTQSTSTVAGASGINTLTVNSSPHTVPIGIIMSIQPSVDLDTNEVTLSVRPTLSRVTGNVSDPAVAFALAQAKAAGVDVSGISSTLPIIEVRELDSILKLKSGQVMVIGGMMQDDTSNNDAGIPGASDVPWFGNLFKGVDKKNNLSELIIFIRATIVDSGGDAATADKAIYQKFTKDPRPLNF